MTNQDPPKKPSLFKGEDALGADMRLAANGEPCPYVAIKGGRTARKVLGHEIISKDLEICLVLLEKLDGFPGDEPLVTNAIWESIITKYGRCFADAKNYRGVRLNREQVFSGCDTSLSRLHDKLIHKRNNFSAHAGESEGDKYELRLALSPKAHQPELLQFYICRRLEVRPINDEKSGIKELFNYVLAHTENRLGGLYQKIKEEYRVQDIDNLYAISK